MRPRIITGWVIRITMVLVITILYAFFVFFALLGKKANDVAIAMLDWNKRFVDRLTAWEEVGPEQTMALLRKDPKDFG